MWVRDLKRVGRHRRMRRVMHLRRAWSQVLGSADPDQVTRLVCQISQSAVPVSPRWARWAGIPTGLAPATERCVQQVMLERLYSQLQPDILMGVAGHPTPLAAPKPWRIQARHAGLTVPEAHARLRYAHLIAWGWARGVLRIVRTSRSAWRGALPAAPTGPYDLFLDLPGSMLPPATATPQTHLVTWLAATQPDVPLWLQTPQRPQTTIGHTLSPAPLPAFPSPKSYLRFLGLGLRATVVSLAAACTGKGELALILGDLIRLAHARAIGPDKMARSYIAENSRWFYRPLFTEWANQAAGSRSELLFYATNMDSCLQLHPSQADPCFLPGYETMSWDSYLVWDDMQAQLVTAWGKDRAQARIVGPVPLSDIDAALPDIPDRSIAVFDVSPYRPTHLAQTGQVPAYYLDAIAANFLTDLLAAATANNAHLVVKQKRAMGGNVPPRYARALRDLLASPNVHVLDPGYGASRVVAACAATVSMPFSSPSLFAADQGRPAAFYDSTGQLKATERQSHGLPTLRGFTALNDWLQTTLTSEGTRP